jgi:hypothetical protein
MSKRLSYRFFLRLIDLSKRYTFCDECDDTTFGYCVDCKSRDQDIAKYVKDWVMIEDFPEDNRILGYMERVFTRGELERYISELKRHINDPVFENRDLPIVIETLETILQKIPDERWYIEIEYI